MEKPFTAVLLLSVILIVCIITPLNFKKEKINTQIHIQTIYEADELAWQIQTFKKIDASVLPSPTIQFQCYNDTMELISTLSNAEVYDFSEYFCVIFEYNGEKRGVHIE